jgi:multicomponent Na+:H+ antiporter subunit C
MTDVIKILLIIFFSLGLYCVLSKKNLLKIIIGLAFMEYAVSAFIIVMGYRWDGHVPIISPSDPKWTYVDPLSQAMVVTVIIVGLATISISVALGLRLYEKYGTFDIDEIKKLRG